MIDNRVIRNHNRLVKKDNINKLIQENSIYNNILDFCNEITSLDNVNDKIKYSISLENLCYTMDNNKEYYDIDRVIQTVTEYFLYNNFYDTKDELYRILEKVSLSKKPDLSKIKELLDKFPMDKIKSKSDITPVVKRFYSLSKNNIIDETPNFLTWIRKGLVYSTIAINPYLGVLNIFIDYFIESTVKRSEVKRMISKLHSEKEILEKRIKETKKSDLVEDYKKYLKEVESNIDKLLDYEESLYSENELMRKDEEEMNLESAEIEYSFTKEEYFDKYHEVFVDQVFKAKQELIRLCNNIFAKYHKEKLILVTTREELEEFEIVHPDMLEEYMDVDNRLMFCIGQFLPYNSEDFVKDEKHIESTRELLFKLCEYVNKVTDEAVTVYFDGNDDIYNIYVSLTVPINNAIQENSFNIEMKKDMAMILAIEEQLKILSTKDTSSVFKNMREEFMNICEDDIEYLSAFHIKHNHIFDENIIKESLLELKNNIYKNTESNRKYIMGSVIQESIYQLSNKEKNNILMPKNRYEVLAELMEINQGLDVLNELSGVNSIKLAQQNLTKKMKTLSDKEKAISRQMDNALDKFYNNIEKELTNKNREKVIKGTILPSASNIVKLAITSGLAYMINPALSVITVLGSIAMSKQGTRKEKQYILDEINIMLKMVDKKIQLAESNNDMKALEQLLRTQQKLERERQRIHYNLRRRNYPVAREKE